MQFWKFFFPTVVTIALLIMIVTNLVFQDIYTSKYASLYNIAFDKLKSHKKYQEFNSSILSDQNIKEKNIATKKKIAYIFAGSARSFVCDKVIYESMLKLSKYCWYVVI